MGENKKTRAKKTNKDNSNDLSLYPTNSHRFSSQQDRFATIERRKSIPSSIGYPTQLSLLKTSNQIWKNPIQWSTCLRVIGLVKTGSAHSGARHSTVIYRKQRCIQQPFASGIPTSKKSFDCIKRLITSTLRTRRKSKKSTQGKMGKSYSDSHS